MNELLGLKRQIHSLKVAFDRENERAKAHLAEANKLQLKIEELQVKKWKIQAQQEFDNLPVITKLCLNY